MQFPETVDRLHDAYLNSLFNGYHREYPRSSVQAVGDMSHVRVLLHSGICNARSLRVCYWASWATSRVYQTCRDGAPRMASPSRSWTRRAAGAVGVVEDVDV